jgi:hypothetical protein
VGEDLGSIVRLIESEHIPKKRGSYPKFLALSHRWGKARASLVLDSSTIEVLSNDVELARLPLTFKDAAQIVQMLGLPAIFVD